MTTRKLTDYYPVYKDISDITGNLPSELKSKDSHLIGYNSDEPDISSPESTESPAIPGAIELVKLAERCGLSSVQTVVLIVKNAFEGHTLLSQNIRPDQIFDNGTIICGTEPEFLMASFYEQFGNYRSGFTEIWKLLNAMDPFLSEKRFYFLSDALVNNHLLRLPVSFFSSTDTRSIPEDHNPFIREADKSFELAILGESILGELEFIKRINLDYSEKFEESVHQLGLKGDILSHYKKKLALALFPDIHTEEELDDLMYRNLIEEKLKSNSKNEIPLNPVTDDNQSDPDRMRLINKTKVLYRHISKNCHEVHSSSDDDNSFSGLNRLFIEATNIYSQSVSTISDSYLQYICLTYILSRVIILRRNQKLEISESKRFLSELHGRELMLTKENISRIWRDLPAKMTQYRLTSFTDYKVKFTVNDNLTEMHSHFLKKQLNFIDEQIINIQKDIKDILNAKSSLINFPFNKN
jgi:hypothetical protein